MILVIFTAFVGMMLAPETIIPINYFYVLLAVTLGAGSSAASRGLHHSVMMAGAHGGTSDLERAADRCIQLNPRIIFDPDPDHHTTMLWEACKRGHKETMVILKLLRKYSSSDEEFVKYVSWSHPQ